MVIVQGKPDNLILHTVGSSLSQAVLLSVCPTSVTWPSAAGWAPAGRHTSGRQGAAPTAETYPETSVKTERASCVVLLWGLWSSCGDCAVLLRGLCGPRVGTLCWDCVVLVWGLWGPPVGTVRSSCGDCAVLVWGLCGPPVGTVWSSCGDCVVLLRGLCGPPVGTVRSSCGDCEVLLWGLWGPPVGTVWSSCGDCEVLLWGLWGPPVGTVGSSCGDCVVLLWGLWGSPVGFSFGVWGSSCGDCGPPVWTVRSSCGDCGALLWGLWGPPVGTVGPSCGDCGTLQWGLWDPPTGTVWSSCWDCGPPPPAGTTQQSQITQTAPRVSPLTLMTCMDTWSLYQDVTSPSPLWVAPGQVTGSQTWRAGGSRGEQGAFGRGRSGGGHVDTRLGPLSPIRLPALPPQTLSIVSKSTQSHFLPHLS